MPENLKKVLVNNDGLEITFFVEDGVARVEFRSNGAVDLGNPDDVILFVNQTNIPVKSTDSTSATAIIGDWSEHEGEAVSLMVRVGETFEGWNSTADRALDADFFLPLNVSHAKKGQLQPFTEKVETVKMRNLVYLILLVFVVSMGTACKNVCDKAADVLEDDCGIDVGDADEDGDDVECEGDVEAGAQCIVDNKDDFCAFLEDPTESNGYTECAADI